VSQDPWDLLTEKLRNLEEDFLHSDKPTEVLLLRLQIIKQDFLELLQDASRDEALAIKEILGSFLEKARAYS